MSKGRIIKISLKYAENLSEFSEFKDKEWLITMLNLPKDDESIYPRHLFIGPFERLPIVIDKICSREIDNNYQTFHISQNKTAYEQVFNVSSKLIRQGELQNTIGQFHFKPIGTIKNVIR